MGEAIGRARAPRCRNVAPSRATRLVAITFAGLLAGCPGRGHSSSTTQTGPKFVDEVAILTADASTAPVQSALATLALNESERPSKRIAALRKLEEVHAPATVPTAEALAADSSRSETAALLRENSTALLVRTPTDQGKAALARVKARSFDAAILAARLERKSEGK